MQNILLSMVQMNSVAGNVNHNLSKIMGFIDSASSIGSDVICFPEACLTGYTSKEPWKYSIESTNMAIQEIIDVVEKKDMIVSFGFIENSDERIYITHLTVDSNGSMVYRKTHLGSNEKGVFTAGNDIPVMYTDNVNIGVHLCWEGHIPEISTVLRSKGAELAIIPHSSGIGATRRKETWERFLPARADDNGMYVAACNAIGYNGIDAVFGGGCIVIDPKGRTIGEYFGDDEHMLTCRLAPDLPRHEKEQNMSSISYFDRRRQELYL